MANKKISDTELHNFINASETPKTAPIAAAATAGAVAGEFSIADEINSVKKDITDQFDKVSKNPLAAFLGWMGVTPESVAADYKQALADKQSDDFFTKIKGSFALMFAGFGAKMLGIDINALIAENGTNTGTAETQETEKQSETKN